MVTKKMFVQVDRLNRTPWEKTLVFLSSGGADDAATVAGGENNFSSGLENASRKSSWGILFAVSRVLRPTGDIYTA